LPSSVPSLPKIPSCFPSCISCSPSSDPCLPLSLPCCSSNLTGLTLSPSCSPSSVPCFPLNLPCCSSCLTFLPPNQFRRTFGLIFLQKHKHFHPYKQPQSSLLPQQAFLQWLFQFHTTKFAYQFFDPTHIFYHLLSQ
jgi:hypothetical protein